MNLTRTFYDGEKTVELEDVGLGDIQAYVLENFDRLVYLNKRKFNEKDLVKTKKVLSEKVLSKDKLYGIIKTLIDEPSFCEWSIEE